MARIRTVKPEFWQDEKLAPLAPIDRLVFLGLVGMADDSGRLLDNVKIIDAFIFPESDDTCRSSLGRLCDLERIKRGVTASGQRVIQVVNWRHQKIDRPNFAGALPPIDGDDPQQPTRSDTPSRRNSTNDRRNIVEPSTNVRRTIPVSTTNDLLPTINDQLPATGTDRVPVVGKISPKGRAA